jgi:hypothetical protein
LADDRQKRKQFLTLNRTILTVDCLILSFPIEGFQKVAPFLFLILNTSSLEPDAERATTAQSKAEGIAASFQDRAASHEIVDKFGKLLSFKSNHRNQLVGSKEASRKVGTRCDNNSTYSHS